MSETEEAPFEVRRVAEKAFVIQRYLLRRAWGVGYVAWSLSIFLTVFVGPIAASLGFPVDARIAMGLLASGAALTIILRAFKRVRDTARIRGLMTEGKWKRILGYRVLVPFWAAVYVTVVLSIFVLGVGNDAILAGYVAFWAFLYYALRLSFPGKLPGEGVAVLSSFGVATAGSMVLLLLGPTDAIIGMLWGVMVTTWIVSAVYARRLPVPTLEEALAA